MGENVQQISTVAVAMLICSSWINFTAVSWRYTAEDSSQGQKGCSFLQPFHLHPGDPEGQLQLQRRSQPAQPIGRRCWISTSSAALIMSLFHQDLLTSLILFHGCPSPPDFFVTRISTDFIVSWQKCWTVLSGQWLQEEYKQKCEYSYNNEWYWKG